MINNPVIFYIASFLIVIFALITMFSKNIINSLLASVVVFFLAAVFFYMLGSEYNAIIQAAIYGLAVPIIIGISVMFTTERHENKKSNTFSLVILVFAVLFLLFFMDSVIFSIFNLPDSFRFTELPQFNSFDVISAFAQGIFINYVFAFELVSLLLTIIIAGIAILRHRERS